MQCSQQIFVCKWYKNPSIKSKELQNKTISIIFGKYFKRLYNGENEITGLNGNMYKFSISYETIDVSDIVSIHKYLMKKHDIV